MSFDEISNTSIENFCTICPKIYASFHYVRHEDHSNYSDEDFAFKRAGDFFLKEMKENRYAGWTTKLDHSSNDLHLSFTFHDQETFTSAWKSLRKNSRNYQIYGIGIFAHHGTNDDGDSTIFGGSPANAENREMTGDEIKKLPSHNWIEEKSFIFFSACNADDGKELVAKAFHESQGVQVIATKAYAYFSTSHEWYKKIGDTDQDIYLLAYARGQNRLDGDGWNYWWGKRIPETSYE